MFSVKYHQYIHEQLGVVTSTSVVPNFTVFLCQILLKD